MIQDIYPHKLDISYKGGMSPNPGSLIVRFEGRRFLCRKEEDGSIMLPSCSEYGPCGGDMIYLFELDGKTVFLDLGKERDLPGFVYEDIATFRTGRPKEILFALSTAYHLYVWHTGNSYCGRCGAKTVHDEKERMLKCPACGNAVYPKIMPSVIVGVTRGDSILMTRYNRPGARLAALVAGFCEIGETAEDTVRREVMEETGLKVRNIRYYKSQPWGITAGGLLLGYWCEAEEGEEIRVEGEEIAEALWVKREDLSEFAGKEQTSLTGEMIAIFAEGKDR